MKNLGYLEVNFSIYIGCGAFAHGSPQIVSFNKVTGIQTSYFDQIKSVVIQLSPYGWSLIIEMDIIRGIFILPDLASIKKILSVVCHEVCNVFLEHASEIRKTETHFV